MFVRSMRGFTISLMVLVALLGGYMFVSPAPSVQAATATGASLFNVDCETGRFSVRVTGSFQTNDGGDEDFIYIGINDGTGSHVWARPASFSLGSTVAEKTNQTFDSSPVSNPLTILVFESVSFGSSVGDPILTATVYSPCMPGGESSSSAGPLPGPDMIPIPEGSAGGTFLSTTPLYFAPSADAASTYIMQAGQSLWVFGMDKSGQFYQVVLSGQKLWVPVEAISPTYDHVWNGHPLPQTTVK